MIENSCNATVKSLTVNSFCEYSDNSRKNLCSDNSFMIFNLNYINTRALNIIQSSHFQRILCVHVLKDILNTTLISYIYLMIISSNRFIPYTLFGEHLYIFRFICNHIIDCRSTKQFNVFCYSECRY